MIFSRCKSTYSLQMPQVFSRFFLTFRTFFRHFRHFTPPERPFFRPFFPPRADRFSLPHPPAASAPRGGECTILRQKVQDLYHFVLSSAILSYSPPPATLPLQPCVPSPQRLKDAEKGGFFCQAYLPKDVKYAQKHRRLCKNSTIIRTKYCSLCRIDVPLHPHSPTERPKRRPRKSRAENHYFVQ